MRPKRELEKRLASGGSAFLARPASTGFTLLEVMVASAILFICVFAILGVVGTAVRSARVVQQHSVDAGMLAAMTVQTNRLEEGTDQGDFEDVAPGSFPGYTWTRDKIGLTNGLFRVDLTVSHSVNGKPIESRMSILVFAPDSPPIGGPGGRLGR